MGRAVSLSALMASLSTALSAAGPAAVDPALVAMPATTRSSSSVPSVNISSTSTPARILMPASWSQVAIGSLQACTSKVQAADHVGRDGRGHPGHLALDRPHPLRRTSYAAGVGEHHLGTELVMSFSEDERGDLEELADRGLRRVPSEIDDGCHVHDWDSSDHAEHTCGLRRVAQLRASQYSGSCGALSDPKLDRSNILG